MREAFVLRKFKEFSFDFLSNKRFFMLKLVYKGGNNNEKL